MRDVACCAMAAAGLALLGGMSGLAQGQVQTVLPGRYPLDLEIVDRLMYFTEVSGEFQVRAQEVWQAWPFGTPQVVNPELAGDLISGDARLAASGAYLYGAWGTTDVTRQPAYGALGEIEGFTTGQATNLAVDDTWVWTGRPQLFIGATIRRTPREPGGSFSSTTVTSLKTDSMQAPGDGLVFFIGHNSMPAIDSVFIWPGSGPAVPIEDLDAPATAFAVQGDFLWWAATPGPDLLVPAIIRTNLETGVSAPLHVISDEDAVVHDLVVDETNAYFMFRSGPGQPSVLRRVPLSGGAHTDIADASGSARLLREVDNWLYWVDAQGVRRVEKNASVARPDLRWARSGYVEAVQAIQGRFAPGELEYCRLVAGRSTMVRAYPRTGDGVLERVQVRLHAYHPGTDTELPGSPIAATRSFMTIDADAGDRGDIDESANFILPFDWVEAGAIDVEARLDPFNVITETNENNNESARTRLEFEEATPVRVTFKPVRAARPDGSDAPLFQFGDPGFWTILSRAQSMMPLARIVPQAGGGVLEEWDPEIFDPFRHGAWELDAEHCIFECFEEDGAALLALELEALGSGFAGIIGDTPSYMVGMVESSAEWRLGGLAHRHFFASLVAMNTGAADAFDRPFGGVTLAHEMSHNFGFAHVSCAGTEAAGGAIDDTYPTLFPPCQIGNSTTDFFRVLGWDWATRSLIETDARPFMSYSAPRWTSPYHWNGTLNIFDALYRRGDGARGGEALPASSHVVVMTGWMDPVSGEVRLLQTHATPRSVWPEENLQRLWRRQTAETAAGPSSHALLVEDGRGGVVEASFTPPAPACTPVTSRRPFIAVAPAEAGVARVRVVRRSDGIEVGRRESSGSPPRLLSIDSPGPSAFFGDTDPITVKWTATDDDGDPLTFMVQYSNDHGATWQTVQSRGDSTFCTFQPDDLLPGSVVQSGSGSSRFRVIASDGLQTDVLESATFRVEDRRPISAIVSPRDGSRYRAGDVILVEGAAYDAERLIMDGPMPWGYEWRINGDLFAHTEAPVLHLTEGLAPGSYVIRLKPYNGGDEAYDDEITLYVGETDPTPADTDGDQVPDALDNCPYTPNPDQGDLDQDGVGDACDNCVLFANADQTDVDEDGFGARCDACPAGHLSGVATDGLAASYGPALAIQDTQTDVGDNTDPARATANGSELDALHAFIDCDTLHVMLAGNLETEGQALELFFDTLPGGQQTLVQSPVIHGVSFERMTADEQHQGFTFDEGFGADFWITVRILEGQSGPTLLADMGVLNGNIFGWRLGQKEADGFGTLLGGDTSAPDVRIVVNNSNTAGVGAGSGVQSGAGVFTGIELAIPLEALGSPACAVRLTSFINGPEREVVSNQFLPGIRGGPSLGESRDVDLRTIPGDQFVTIERTDISPPVGGLEGFRFEATATVYAPVGHTVRWTRDHVPVVDDGRIRGAGTARLVIDPVVVGDEGVYRAVVTTPCGSNSRGSLVLAMTPPGCLGDVNRDGVVDFADLEILLEAWSESVIAGAAGDLDENGAVNFADLEILLEAWGRACGP